MTPRWLQNILRFPTRTWQSIARRLDPQYRIQYLADAFVRDRMAPARLAELDSIPGNTSQRKCRLLYFLAATAPAEGCAVEIGAFKGKSTAWIAEAFAGTDRHFISIDPHLGGSVEAFEQTVEKFGLADRVDIRRAYSHDVGKDFDQPIAFLWVDGSHEYEHVLQDIHDFTPHLIVGGTVVFDDVDPVKFPGVVKAIDETLGQDANFRSIGRVKTFTVFERCGADRERAGDWRYETLRYVEPHERLHKAAAVLADLPQRRVLDVGCSTAALRTLLPADMAYFGCDVTDYAKRDLGDEHFRQIDLNAVRDVEPFAGWTVDVVHLGGVLEYLADPTLLLSVLRQVTGPSGRLVMTTVNFESDRQADPAGHHPAWVFKPTADQIRDMLEQAGWTIQQQWGSVEGGLGKRRSPQWEPVNLEHDSATARRRIRQYMFLAEVK